MTTSLRAVVSFFFDGAGVDCCPGFSFKKERGLCWHFLSGQGGIIVEILYAGTGNEEACLAFYP
ncbi:hypothetical protein V3F56_06470 [Moorellaceae bacterium AZ2]